MFSLEEKEFFMSEALAEAQKALLYDEVPIGAVIVQVEQEKQPSGLYQRVPNTEAKIIARSFNRRELDQIAVHHAEINAIIRANQKLESWRLLNSSIFVTVEPCLMCAGAISLARFSGLYYGVKNEKFGAVESLFQAFQNKKLNHQLRVESGILEKECAQIMKDFFKSKRK
ncbi:MAG: nucleoside deaminase [Lactovum sp.]